MYAKDMDRNKRNYSTGTDAQSSLIVTFTTISRTWSRRPAHAVHKQESKMSLTPVHLHTALEWTD